MTHDDGTLCSLAAAKNVRQLELVKVGGAGPTAVIPRPQLARASKSFDSHITQARVVRCPLKRDSLCWEPKLKD